MNGRDVFSFPNPVNELSARLVAGGVVTMAVAAIVFGLLMRWGVIPDEVCERCNDIWGGARGRAPGEDRLPEVGRVLDEQRRVPPHEREPQRDTQHAR